VLRDLANLVDNHQEELALLESLDVGKPIRDAYDFDVPSSANVLRFNADAADKLHSKIFGADRTSLSYELHRPVGVVGAITAWNFPLLQAASKIGPALATGNCLILKPSELTSLSTARLAELAVEAGVPEGVLNVIHGDGAVGAVLARHVDVDLLSFTGSSRTGKQLLVAAGESNMKRVLLECGGKSANIVFDDCPDLDAVAAAVVRRAFWNQGEVCTASSRLLVHEPIKEALLERVIYHTSQLGLGDPLDPMTQFGALISRSHLAKVVDYIAVGAAEGALMIYKSDDVAPDPRGYYASPIIYDAVTVDHRIAQDEIFGPVLSVLSFADEADALRIANQTIYGLSAILWTCDMSRAHRMCQDLAVGWTTVNLTAEPVGGPPYGATAIGGHKQSGVGVEGGIDGLAEYLTRTAVQIFV